MSDTPPRIFLAPINPKYAVETYECAETDLWDGQGVRYIRQDRYAEVVAKLKAVEAVVTAKEQELDQKIRDLPCWQQDAEAMARALHGVTLATTDYLVPDGIDAEDALAQIIAETDNREIALVLAKYPRP